MRILMDLDGVLVNFFAGSMRLHGIQGNYRDLVGGDGENRYNINKAFQISDSAFWAKIDAVGQDFWADLDWHEDGKQLLKAAEKLVSPERVCLCSSPAAAPSSSAGKMVWIQRELPAYRRRYLLGPCKEFCASPKAILVDDSDKNVEKFRKAGGRAVLVPRAWNSLHAVADVVGYVTEQLLILTED